MRRPPTIERPKTKEPRVNNRIRVREVRVIGPDGDQLGIVPTDDALRRSAELGLDLVEVSPMSRPPVCKIMDYGKYKYTTKKKAVEQRRNQRTVEVKEVKFRPKTDQHDIAVKLSHVRRFLGEQNKVKLTIMFRGREITHPEIGHQILNRVAQELVDCAAVELAARMEGRTMFMILTPLKSAGKAAPKATAPSSAPKSPSAPEQQPLEEIQPV